MAYWKSVTSRLKHTENVEIQPHPSAVYIVSPIPLTAHSHLTDSGLKGEKGVKDCFHRACLANVL